jgi:alkanesulfonate monooxygenase SsuD/methylene tetrahydromethanopterin reductase-like flavin-dependent oxidoreductase (luciferase family)
MTTNSPVSGAWDTHVHAGPDVTERKHNIVELARHAAEAGMGGLLLKNHHFPTATAAGLVEAINVGIELASAVVLNRSVGGLNLAAGSPYGFP